MTEQPVRLGLIGCGVVSQTYILPHVDHDDVNSVIALAAVCDTDDERAETTAHRWNIGSWYTDHEKMLASEDLDGVIVASPIPFHHEQALAALRSGNHVYVQKTIAETSSQARELVEVAEETDRVLVVSPGQMLNPGYQAVRKAISDGVLGKVYWAFGSTAAPGHEHSPHRQQAGANPAWFYRKGAGPLPDMGVYVLHTLTGVLGPALSVTALSGRGQLTRQWGDMTFGVEVDDNTLMLLEFQDEILGVCGAHYCHPGTRLGWGFLGFYGSNGALEITPEKGTSYPGAVVISPNDLVFDVPTGSESMPMLTKSHTALPGYHVWADIRHFIDCVRSGQKPLVNARQAIHVVEIIEKSRIAASTGQEQTIESTF